MAAETTGLRVDRVSRTFGNLSVLEDISLAVGAGEFVALVGPSGCGKTTLLNLLSGYDAPTSGSVERPPNVRMVYQQDGLLPWLTVRQNVELGNNEEKEKRRKGEKERGRETSSLIPHPSSLSASLNLLSLVGLEEFADSYPYQLSGGMRQRAELARALGGNTDLLLLDEPFSALDYLTRLRLRQELALILRQRPTQTVLVTHDIEEACQLADRVLVLSARPARIQCEIPITLPRPRPPLHPQVVEATQRVLAEMGV